MKLLLIEDQRPLALALVRLLKDDGFAVTWHADGADGLTAALTGEYDLVILDLLLPSKNGWAICREIRDHDMNTPILMLSALDAASDKVDGLDAGADDFLAKPFDNGELIARIHALLRKNLVHRGQIIKVADLEIDRDHKQVSRKGAEIQLSPIEFELLVRLAAREGRVVKPNVLAHNVSLVADSIGDPLESCMSTLRAKIDGPFETPLIRTSEGAYLLCAGANR